MKIPKRLVLIRHGRSLLQQLKPNRYWDNARVRNMFAHLPDADYPLTSEGVRQAAITGQVLYQAFGPFHRLCTSDYRRAIQTGKYLVRPYSETERRRLVTCVTPLLRERHAGAVFARTAEEIARQYPQWIRQLEELGEYRYQFEGGESLEGLCQGRCREWCQSLAEFQDQNVLAVVHWGSLLSIRAVLEGWTEDQILNQMGRCHPPNCSVTLYEQGLNGEAKLVLQNFVLY